jgi:hypothetical protein
VQLVRKWVGRWGDDYISKLDESWSIISIAGADLIGHAGGNVLIKTNGATWRPGVSCPSTEPCVHHGHFVAPSVIIASSFPISKTNRRRSECLIRARALKKEQSVGAYKKYVTIRSFEKDQSSLTIFSQTCCPALNPVKFASWRKSVESSDSRFLALQEHEFRQWFSFSFSRRIHSESRVSLFPHNHRVRHINASATPFLKSNQIKFIHFQAQQFAA